MYDIKCEKELVVNHSHVKGGIDMRIRKEPPGGWFGEKLYKRDETGKVRGSSILTPRDDPCKFRLEPFSEDTVMVPPASRG